MVTSSSRSRRVKLRQTTSTRLFQPRWESTSTRLFQPRWEWSPPNWPGMPCCPALSRPPRPARRAINSLVDGLLCRSAELPARNSKRDRSVGNQPRRTGQTGWPRYGLKQVDRRVGHPQLQGVFARREIAGQLHFVGLPQTDSCALAIDQHLERVVPHFGIEEDPLAGKIIRQLEAAPVEPATRVVGIPLLDPRRRLQRRTWRADALRAIDAIDGEIAHQLDQIEQTVGGLGDGQSQGEYVLTLVHPRGDLQ